MVDIPTGRWRVTTRSTPDGFPSQTAMVEPETIHYPSSDGRRIPALLYRPRGAGRARPVPVVVSIHGGPEDCEHPEYSFDGGVYQYLLHKGIGVLAPNIRGSTGFGRSYQRLIYRDWGGGDLDDLEHAARYLRRLDWVDPKRLGVMGTSYGGFATLSCIARLPGYWAAAIDVCGPSDLVTFALSAPPHWRRRLRSWIGDPAEEAAWLRTRSPITYADHIRTPLLVIQGAQDTRVAKHESDQLVERLRALGRTVEYVVFDDEGHDIVKRHNRQRLVRLTARWLERHLLGTNP
jgi:dipeptidyl aminopeptidase/acylaminoacyl peptidase